MRYAADSEYRARRLEAGRVWERNHPRYEKRRSYVRQRYRNHAAIIAAVRELGLI